MRSSSTRAVACIGLAGLAVSLLGGCYHDKLTYDNFSLVQAHRTDKNAVSDLIGDPDNILLDRWIYRRPEKSLHVVITFDDELVARKEWMDAQNDRWEDTDEKSAGGEESASETTYHHTEKGP